MEGMCIELGQLVQGCKDTKGTETIKFMALDEIPNIPQDWTVTYAQIVVDYLSQKYDPNFVCTMVGDDLIEYPGELTTWTADLTTFNVM